VKDRAVRFTAVCALVAALVVLIGGAVVAPPQRDAVRAGAAIGAVVQVAGFWIFAVWLFPGRLWEGYGLGLLARFAAFAVVALWMVPAMGLPLAVTLFAMVGVFWLTTMVEPLFMKARTPNSTQR
jgi:hypothetical protein